MADDLNNLVFQLTELVSETTPGDMLQHIAFLATEAVPMCDCCGVSMVEGDRIVTRAASDDRADRVDHAQYSADEGPCIQAIRTGHEVAVDDFGTEQRWPGFVPRALEAGIAASYSVPLRVKGEVVGSINCYSDGGAFDEHARSTCRAFAAQAGVALVNTAIFERTRDLISQLNEAIGSRDVIGQAKGIIMATEAVGPDEAFDRLRRRSQHENRKLRDVAADIVDGRGG